MTPPNPPGRSCKGLNARGEPCAASSSLVDEGTGFCPAHGPGASERMRERGLRGGIATRNAWKRPGLSDAELGELTSLIDAQRWLRVIGSAVATGRLDRGDAQAATRAVEVWIRASDSLTEGEIQALHDKLEAVKSGKPPKLRTVK